MGNQAGELNYMENTGTSTAPVFVQRTGNANPFDAVGLYGIYVGSSSAPALADFDNDGTLRPCPSIDKLRPHVFVSPQAIWTLSWAKAAAISSTWRTPGRLLRRRSC